jgi:signal transduction histidine kinase
VEVQQKGAEIILGELPLVRANRRQMQQLFQNLISNALKYAKPDVRPRIEIRSNLVNLEDIRPGFAREAEGKYHQIIVQDNGIGFSQVDAQRIFNIFTRLHGTTEYRGTGVGLSIAQKVVENHQGFIWAESHPDEGARFYVLLPANSGLGEAL